MQLLLITHLTDEQTELLGKLLMTKPGLSSTRPPPKSMDLI